jgi:hypothetical protein
MRTGSGTGVDRLIVVLALVAGLVGTGLFVRRHLSLPTQDGRVPLVGLDRELSAEALFPGTVRPSATSASLPRTTGRPDASAGQHR